MLRLDALVDMVIQAKKSGAIASGRKFKLRKAPRVLPPTTPQREYLRELIQMNKLMRQIVGEVVAPLIPAIIEQANSQRPKLDSYKADDFNDLIDAAFERAKLQFYRKYTDQEVEGIARRAAGRVDNFNIRMINKVFGAVVEVKLPGNEPWLQQEIKAFTKSNVSLIKSISSNYFDKVEQQVTQAAQRGVLGKDFAKTIAKQYDLSESRAKLIARDQVSKFNADLTQSRQKSVGIKKYVWSTSNDERVRPEHEERDGKEFSWDDPPWDGHPGEPIQCRCVAIPVFFEE